MKPDFWVDYLMGISMVVSISPNFQGGGRGDDVIRDRNIPQNSVNDNNKRRTPNRELKLGIQTNFGKGKVMASFMLQYFQ